MFGLSTLQLAAVALVAAFFMSGVAYVKGRTDGRHIGAVQALKAQNDQLNERNETDAEINSMDQFNICLELLGGVPDCDEFR